MTLKAVISKPGFRKNRTMIGRKVHPEYSYVVVGDELFQADSGVALGRVTLSLQNAIATDWEIRKERVK